MAAWTSVTRSGSTDTLASGDCAKDVVYSHAGAVAASLPSASSLGSGWFVSLTAATGASVTVTSAGGNFSSTGSTTLTIAAGAAASIVSDGTNFSVNASGSGASSSGSSGALQTSNGAGGFSSIAPGSGVAAALANATNGSSGLLVYGVGINALSGWGTGVATALAAAANGSGGVALLNGSPPTNGHCLDWASGGIADAGAACGGGGGSPGGATNEVQINNSGSFGGGGVTITGAPGTLGSLDNGGAGYVSSYWYNFQPSAIMASGAVQIASQIYCTPNSIEHSGFTAVGMGVRVSTGASGGHISLALYKADGTAGRPGTHIVDTGALTTTSGNADVSGSFTTTALPRGVYWICSSVDNATNILVAMSGGYSGYGERYIGSSTVSGSLATANTNSGLQCLAGGSCGGSTAAWSAGSFTWPSLSSATWTLGGSGSPYTAIALQAQ